MKNGSFFNQLMAETKSAPVVGEFATILHYTDRTVCKVVSIGDVVTLERLEATHDTTKEGGHGHQNWVFNETGVTFDLVQKNGQWFEVFESVEFCPKFLKECETKGIYSISKYLSENYPDVYTAIWQGDAYPVGVVEGYTVKKKKKSKIDIIFGVANYYYDWEF